MLRLTEGLNGSEERASWSATRVEQRKQRRSRGELLQGSSGLLISTDRLGVYLRRSHGDQGGPGITGSEES
jgi:hypothetical protein